MGKIILIEGTDGCGKQTQAEILTQTLAIMGKRVLMLSFPMYDSDTSMLVKMYLGGEFGEHADDVDPYQASLFYAADRVGSYLKDWKKDYEDPETILVMDRYVSSNAIYQGAKIRKPLERQTFIQWVFDFEYVAMQLPKPDLSIFLNMPVDVSESLMSNRKNKITNQTAKDIHESDDDYLRRGYKTGLWVAKNYGFNIIDCAKDGNPRSREEVASDIFVLSKTIIGG